VSQDEELGQEKISRMVSHAQPMSGNRNWSEWNLKRARGWRSGGGVRDEIGLADHNGGCLAVRDRRIIFKDAVVQIIHSPQPFAGIASHSAGLPSRAGRWRIGRRIRGEKGLTVDQGGGVAVRKRRTV